MNLTGEEVEDIANLAVYRPRNKRVNSDSERFLNIKMENVEGENVKDFDLIFYKDILLDLYELLADNYLVNYKTY